MVDEWRIANQLGEMNGRLGAIERRLDDGSKRHADLDRADDGLAERVAKLELVEAKRAGVFVTIGALGSLLGTGAGLLINYLLKKF